MAHEGDQARHDAGLHHHVNAVVGAVGEVGGGPAGVRQDVLIAQVEQLDQGGQNLVGQEEILLNSPGVLLLVIKKKKSPILYHQL